jgi:hypothetical protein
MILETKEDFEKAIITRKEIKQKVIFYTEEDSELSPIVVDSEKPKIGDLYKNGIYIGSYNGKDVVMALKDEGEYTFDEAMDLEDKRPLSFLEWLLYLENKEIIDKKLKEHGGEPLKGEYYWSSSESYGYRDYAWYVRPSDGDVGNYDDKHYSKPVRCVLAL